MAKRVRAGIYLRVSTTEQDTANQLPALEEYAQRRSLEVVGV